MGSKDKASGSCIPGELMRSDQLAIVARGLTRTFGDFTAVDNIDFHVRRGEIFGFLGPNGAGKTTTIRMMLGLLPATDGTVRVLGVPVSQRPQELRPRVGYMAQRFSLYNDLTVLQNLRFYGRAYGLENNVLKERILEALQITGLEGREHVRTKDLSGGWRQRLALNAAILHRPELVVLDEPTAGVDPISRRASWDLLYKLVARGITVFVTTHYMDEAEHCHRLAFIQRGKLIACGTPGEIKRDVMSGDVLEITPDDTAKAVQVLRAACEEGRLPLDQVTMYGPLMHVTGPALERHRDAIAAELRRASIEPREMVVIEPSLEDVFIECMQG
jgi:ABC-2 type transport system ATP-binding protein